MFLSLSTTVSPLRNLLILFGRQAEYPGSAIQSCQQPYLWIEAQRAAPGRDYPRTMSNACRTAFSNAVVTDQNNQIACWLDGPCEHPSVEPMLELCYFVRQRSSPTGEVQILEEGRDGRRWRPHLLESRGYSTTRQPEYTLDSAKVGHSVSPTGRL